jgi:hypothetical protein
MMSIVPWYSVDSVTCKTVAFIGKIFSSDGLRHIHIDDLARAIGPGDRQRMERWGFMLDELLDDDSSGRAIWMRLMLNERGLNNRP